ncbi:MAG: NAD(P)-binding protein [Candidatus Promineifilaceae bacterium]
MLSDTKGVDILTILDTVIVGAGQAGLGVSYFLQQNGRKHILFERERIGESWLSQRWDSFKLNTPNYECFTWPSLRWLRA